MFNNLRTKIFALFGLMLVSIMALVLVLISRTTFDHTFEQIKMQLLAGYQVFENELSSQREYQQYIAQVVSKDFGLLSEIAQANADAQNIQSLQVTLDNFRNRSSADLALVITPDKALLAATHPQIANNLEIESLQMAQTSNAQLLVIEGNLFHAFITPIYAPKPNLIGWLVMAFKMDNAYAEKLSTLTDLQVSFHLNQNDQIQKLAASSANKDSLSESDLQTVRYDQIEQVNLDIGEYLIYQSVVEQLPNKTITVVLHRSLTEALHDFDVLRMQLIGIIIFAIVIAAFTAYLIASSVTKPLAQMVSYIRKLGQGDYTASAPKQRTGEVGILFDEFSAMQSEIAQREEDITELAYFDSLTKLPNRNQFLQQLNDQLQPNNLNTHSTVLVMDLDNFKDINDTLSHVSGDELLKQIANRLEKACRPQDKIARLGGDEFAILVKDVDRHELIAVTKEYQKVLSAPFNIEGIQLYVNATIGIAIYPEHGENPLSLLQHAEVAMYVGKEQSLPYCLYNIQQDRHSLLRLTLMGELIGAIERDELTLYFQPKLNLKTNQIHAVECLVRWIHPEHGFIPPDDFIPLAEQTGNIRFLTEWVMETALKQCKSWRENNIDLTMAVNISAMDLQQRGFKDFVGGLLNKYFLPTSSLVLEVTESSIMHDTNKAIAMLSDIYDMGVHLSIDDYGTGYSSMAQLKSLPVQELKIDKSFVQDLDSNKDDAIIVRSTIELGHNMGLKIVAEGVESIETLETLRKWGCDTIQGYFLSKPLPTDEFEEWLKLSSYLPDFSKE